MSKKSKTRMVVARLFSLAGTGYIYTLRRPRSAPKFELIKYDPMVRQHVLFSENKPSGPSFKK